MNVKISDTRESSSIRDQHHHNNGRTDPDNYIIRKCKPI